MSGPALAVLALGAAAALIAALAGIPALRRALAGAARGVRPVLRPPRPSPERFQRAAELRAEELLGSVAGNAELEEYRALGFLHVFGAAEQDGMPGYGYLIYPHRPIVSFDARSGRLLNELCVSFPERESGAPDGRLPDADDVLAKWLAIQADELGLLAEANLWPPGRQIDPEQARRDLVRLGEWTERPSDSRASGSAPAP